MSYADHDLTIYRDKNGCPIATDVSKTIDVHRKALDRMADQLETLYAQSTGPERWPLMQMATRYRELRTRINSIEADR
jgi:hypothetical protein